MEAKDIYITQALSTKDLLGQAGQCFYLPSYQRQYAWDALQVKQLCDDIFDGISRLYDNDKTFTFCGSVITVKDANASSVHPKVIQDQPTSVLLLIDGQQRLTTLMMIVMAVHEAIQNRIDLFKKDRVGAVPGVDDWLYANAKSACADLHNALVVTRPEEHGKKPLYPRMIRAGFDEWSPNKDTQKYESPIAFVVNEYMAHNVAHKNSGVATFYTPPTRPKTVFRGEKEFLIRFSEIKSMVQNQITGNTDDGDEFIPLSKTLYNQQILSELNISPGDAQKKEFSQIPLGDTDFAELLRTLVIARYLLTRVAITSIQCKDEEYAFEVFEALNTSGTPLTAFETFVPMVVSRIGEKVYATSQQKVEIDKINNFFDGFDAGAAREKKTKELVTHFANSETGEKLGSHISRQQLFFRRLLQGKQAIEVAEVVHNFYHVKNLVEGFDSGISPTVPMISAADGDFLNLAFSFFKALTHTIVIPPLAAFYSKAVDAQNQPATADYVAAVKASLAFTVLWRSCFSNTHGIDSRYRDLMKNNDDFFYRGLARDLKNPVDINLFKAELRRVLKDKGKIDKKVTFLEKSRLIEFYTVSKPLTRIVLLAAHDQSAVTASGGLIQGRPNLHPYLTVEQFNGKEMAAIEHIAPQTRSNNWSHEIYAAGYLHRIGNLTLTSQKLNSSFGARSWEEKKVLYDALSQQVPDDARQTFDAAFANGIAFGEQTEELMAEYKYTPILESLSKFTDWNKTSCEDRGINILERTWDYFWPFLN